MKAVINTNQYYLTIDDVKNIDGVSLNNGHEIFCKEKDQVFKLFKGAKDGDIPLNDKTGWFVRSLLRKPANLIYFVDSVEVDQTDVTTVTLLHNLNKKIYDYHYIRNQIKEFVVSEGFENFSNDEKEIIAKYCATDASTIVGYFMGAYGLTMGEAVSKYKVYRSIDISEAAIALSARASNPVVNYIAVKYMSEANASSFSDAIRNFITDLKEVAHLGTNYGQARDGIMDYIEATSSYIDAGLKSYSFENGFTYEQCRDEFKNYLVYGIKPEEFDVFSPS